MFLDSCNTCYFVQNQDLTRLPSQTTSSRWQVDKEAIGLSRVQPYSHLCVARPYQISVNSIFKHIHTTSSLFHSFIIQEYLHYTYYSRVPTLHLLFKSTYTTLIIQEYLHYTYYSRVPTLHLLFKSTYTTLIIQEYLNCSLINAALCPLVLLPSLSLKNIFLSTSS